MWPKAKRAVSDEVAAQIASIAAQHGAQAVGVFVDEDAATITDRWVHMHACHGCARAWLLD